MRLLTSYELICRILEEWDTHLFHTDNSILLYMGKFPKDNYKKVTFINNS